VNQKEEYMEPTTFSSPAIAKEMERIYGKNTKVVKIEMFHEEDVKKYVMKIEEAHKKAAESKLLFR
jgi:mannose/fructose-specific phosphotransferase system component IIA